MGVAVICIAILVISYALWIPFALRTRRERRDQLEDLADGFLENATCGRDVRGQRAGVPVRLHPTERGGRYTKTPWIEIDVEIPARYPFLLWLRRHGAGDRANGEWVDVKLDVPEFDDAFLVEGAPADVVGRLLDEPTRAYLLAHPEIELHTLALADRRVLRMAVKGPMEIGEQRQAIDIPVTLVRRLAEAYSDADAAAAPAVVGDAYRPMLDDRSRETAARDREQEVRDLAAMQRRRGIYGLLTVGLVCVLICVGAYALIALLDAKY